MVNLIHTLTQASRPHPSARLPLLSLAFFAVLLCLIPKPENDLFFELRIGTDILHTRHLPHADLYSWTRRGTPWDVPEWGAFVLYALAFRAAGFGGTWLLMATLTLAAATLVWAWLTRQRVAPAPAAALTALALLTASPCLQERPYAFTYPLLAAALIRLDRGRRGSPHALWALVPLCVLWTNLHQGVLAFVCLLLACALGDALTAAWKRRQAAASPLPDLLTPAGREHAGRAQTDPDRPQAHAARARHMLAAAAACAAAALCSPYGLGVYRSVFVTLRDRQLMANVTEWNPITVLPPSQIPPFLLLAFLTLSALAFTARQDAAPSLPVREDRSEAGREVPMTNCDEPSPRGSPGQPRLPTGTGTPLLLEGEGTEVRSEEKGVRSPGGEAPSLADALMLTGLLVEALLHARNTALFAVGAAIIAAPYLAPAGAALARRLRLAPPGPRQRPLFALGACLGIATATIACGLGLQRAAGPHGLSPEDIGEAVARVPTYPAAACAFMDARNFPSHLRLLNSFEDGGYLMWRLPREPVFIDGRLDVYTGRTFADTLTLTRAPAGPAADALRARYDLDCVLTGSPRQARALAADPRWQIVYTDPRPPRTRIFLRRRPQFAPLIARCLRTSHNSALVSFSPPLSFRKKRGRG